MTTKPKSSIARAGNAAEAGPHLCKRCGIQADESGCIVRVSCGLETPALKKLRAEAEVTKDKLDQIALDEFGKDGIARFLHDCGIDQHVLENADLVFIYTPREDWPPGAQAAWDAREAAMAAFAAYDHEPDVPAHLRLQDFSGA